MKTTIVMSTYNGSKYLVEQLRSILNQKVRADQVIINDDNSSDETVKIVRNFIEENNLQDTWTVNVNNPGKGCYRNFMEGAQGADGDIVFFSDQDDIWDADKIAVMKSGFEKHDDMLACYCQEEYVDENGIAFESPMRFTHNNKASINLFNKVSFEDNIRINKCPGLCLAVRRDALSEVTGFILKNKLMHDLPIGNYCAMKRGLYVTGRRLVYYRQHFNNLSAPKLTVRDRIKNIDYQIRGRKGRLRQYEAFYKEYKENLTSVQQKQFTAMLRNTSESLNYLENKNLWGAFKHLFVCNPFVNKWITLNNFLCILYAKF